MRVPLQVLVPALLLACVDSVTLVTDLPAIVTTENEVFSFPLTSYFSGNDVVFSIPGDAQADVQVQNPFTISTAPTEFAYAAANQYSGATPNNVLLDVLSPMGTTYLLNPYNNVLQCYSISPIGEVTSLWNHTIALPYESPVITRVRHFETDSGLFAAVLIKSVQVEEKPTDRVDVVVIDITNTDEAPTDQHILEIEDFQFFADVDFVTMSTVNGWTLLIVSCADTTRTPPQYALMGYNISDFANPSWLQTVSKYQNIPGFPEGVALRTVGIAFLSNFLYVLDQQVGLVTFLILDEEFMESDFIDIVRFGTPTSVNAPVSSSNFLAVGTEDGLLIIDFTENDNEFKWIPIELQNGVSWTPYSAALSGHYVFANCQQGDSTSLMVLDYLDSFASSVKHQWDFTQSIPAGDYLPFGMYTVVQLLNPSDYLYIRGDKDALRVYSATAGVWVLQGTSSEQGPYSVKVQAQGSSPIDVATSTLFVDYLALQNTTILYGNGYSLDNEITAPDLIPDITGATATVSIPISDMFSGPNMDFTLTFGSISPGIVVNFEPKLSKLIETSMNVPEDLSQSAYLLSVTDESVIIGDSDVLMSFSTAPDSLALMNKTKPMAYNPISVCESNGLLFVLGKTENGSSELVAFDSELQALFSATKVSAACTKVECLINYVYCVSPAEIDVYSPDDLSAVYQISAASVSVATMHVTSITAQYSQYSERFILFIACATNGVFPVDITNIAYAPQKLTTANGLPQETAVVDLYSPDVYTLVVVRTDGVVLVVDIENSPKMTVVKNLPAWEDAEALGIAHTSGFTVVAMGGTKLYFFDTYNTVHDSLFYIVELPSYCAFAGYGNSIYTLCLPNTGAVLTQYFAPGQTSDSGFAYTYDVTMSLKLNQFQSDTALLNATVSASNSFGSFASLPVPISLQSQGHIIFQNATALPSNLLFIPYNESTSLDVATVFSGQNLELFININGQYPYIYYNETNYDPAVLWPAAELTDNYTFEQSANSTVSSVLLLPGNLTLTMVDTTLSVFHISAEPHGEWADVPSAELLAEVDILTVADNPDLQNCPLMTLVDTNDTAALLAVYCSGATVMAGSSISGETTFDQMSFFNFHYDSNNLTLAAKDLLFLSPVIVKTAPSLTARHYYIMIADDPDGGAENNHFLWTEVQWNEDGSVENCANSIIVDFFLLKLDQFSVMDADAYATDSGAYIYVADANYGLRVLQYSATPKFTVSLVASLPLPVYPDSYVPGDIIESVALCGDSLYAMESSSILLRFSLEKPEAPTALAPFQRYNTAENVYRSHTAALMCSSRPQHDGRLLVARMSDGQTVARIFDLQADEDSTILRDIDLGESLSQHTQLFSFIDNQLLATVESAGFAFQVWYLRHPYLEFPEFSDEEYEQLVSQWGTPNFTVHITAINDQMELNSSAVLVTRMEVPTPKPSPHHGGGGGDSYWWVWLIVAIAVVLSFVGGFFAVRAYRKRHSSSSERSISRAEEPLGVNDFRSLDD